MMLYPYVHDGVISHGRAAEILGIFKTDLIVLYGKMGLPYVEMTDDEIEEELAMVKELGGGMTVVIVISDTTPILSLLKAGHLELLENYMVMYLFPMQYTMN